MFGKRVKSMDFGPHVDLKSVRLTLEYMHDDLSQHHRLERVAKALKSTLAELDAIGYPAEDARFERFVALPEGRQLR